MRLIKPSMFTIPKHGVTPFFLDVVKLELIFILFLALVAVTKIKCKHSTSKILIFSVLLLGWF